MVEAYGAVEAICGRRGWTSGALISNPGPRDDGLPAGGIMRVAIRSPAGVALASLLLLLGSLPLSGCSGKKEEAQAPEATQAAGQAAADAAAEEPLSPPAYESALPESVRAALDQPFTGDLDAMVQRRLVRIGVAHNRTMYFVDQGVQRGGAYEYGKLMEEEINKRRKTGNL
jgi:hypothetical protein